MQTNSFNLLIKKQFTYQFFCCFFRPKQVQYTVYSTVHYTVYTECMLNSTGYYYVFVFFRKMLKISLNEGIQRRKCSAVSLFLLVIILYIQYKCYYSIGASIYGLYALAPSNIYTIIPHPPATSFHSSHKNTSISCRKF